MAISSGDNETIAISDMTYNEIMDMGTLVKEGFLMKNPSRWMHPPSSAVAWLCEQRTHARTAHSPPRFLECRQGNFQLGFTKQRFIVLHTDRLMWFKKGEASDCLLGEVPITESTEVIKHAANLLGPEKITVKTGSKARLQPTGALHTQSRTRRAAAEPSDSHAPSVAVAVARSWI